LGGLLGHVRQNRLARKSEPTSPITKIRSVSASLWIAPEAAHQFDKHTQYPARQQRKINLALGQPVKRLANVT
jgi:hypothetical protein